MLFTKNPLEVSSLSVELMLRKTRPLRRDNIPVHSHIELVNICTFAPPKLSTPADQSESWKKENWHWELYLAFIQHSREERNICPSEKENGRDIYI